METIELAGRQFLPTTHALSAAQSDFIHAHLVNSGALEILTDADGKKRDDLKRGALMLNAIKETGRKQLILAGCLTEVGKKWNREQALRNAEIFDEITDETEQARMNVLIIRLVIAFFGLGKTSRANSPRSSHPSEKVLPTENAEPSISANSAG